MAACKVCGKEKEFLNEQGVCQECVKKITAHHLVDEQPKPRKHTRTQNILLFCVGIPAILIVIGIAIFAISLIHEISVEKKAAISDAEYEIQRRYGFGENFNDVTVTEPYLNGFEVNGTVQLNASRSPENFTVKLELMSGDYSRYQVISVDFSSGNSESSDQSPVLTK